MDKGRAQRESFVVRLWRGPDTAEWQGWVQHVRSGDTTALRNLDELIPFIERWVIKPEGEGQRGLR